MKIKVFKIRIAEKFVEKDQNQLNRFLAGVDVKKTETSLVEGEEIFWSILVHYTNKSKTKEGTSTGRSPGRPKGTGKSKPVKVVGGALTNYEQKMLKTLKNWRRKKAKELDEPSFMILWDQHLRKLVQAKPSTRQELREIDGFTEHKLEKYGDEVLGILEGF